MLESRNTVWYVTTNKVNDPLLERRTLEALEINKKDMMDAVIERQSITIDIDLISHPEEQKSGSVTTIVNVHMPQLQALPTG